MSQTKEELLVQLSGIFRIVGTPTVNSSLSWANITSYDIPVLAWGKSNKENQLASERSIPIAVYKEGTGDEDAAVWSNDLIQNPVNDSLITTSDELDRIIKIYNDDILRGRVKASIGKLASSVLFEANPTSNLTFDVLSSGNYCYVNSASSFFKGKTVTLIDSAHSKDLIIDHIIFDQNLIYFTTNLVNGYSVANSAHLDFKTNSERVAWSKSALKDTDINLDIFMWEIVMNTVVQTSGGKVSNGDIDWIVNKSVIVAYLALGLGSIT